MIKQMHDIFFKINSTKIFIACKSKYSDFSKDYCNALELIESYYDDKLKYFSKRLNELIEKV